MTDDLVKRLRQLGDRNGLMFVDYDATIEAADRIEKLEAALRELSTDWDCCVVSKNMKLIARKALEGKND